MTRNEIDNRDFYDWSSPLTELICLSVGCLSFYLFLSARLTRTDAEVGVRGAQRSGNDKGETAVYDCDASLAVVVPTAASAVDYR